MTEKPHEFQVENRESQSNAGRILESEDRQVEDRGPVRRAEPPAWLLALMDHIEGQVAFGDTKAGLLLTADSILLAGLATALGGDKPLVDRPTGLSQAFAALALTALSAGLIAALMTVLPNRRNLWPRSTPPQNRFSFSWIAGQRPEVFVRAVREEEDGDLTAELATVVHGKSEWARRKFVRLYVAVLATTLGLLLALAAVASVAM
jgi:hypothetical protein